jgi:hypothetical protein
MLIGVVIGVAFATAVILVVEIVRSGPAGDQSFFSDDYCSELVMPNGASLADWDAENDFCIFADDRGTYSITLSDVDALRRWSDGCHDEPIADALIQLPGEAADDTCVVVNPDGKGWAGRILPEPELLLVVEVDGSPDSMTRTADDMVAILDVAEHDL